MAIGTALSGVSFKRLGFYGVYAVSAAVYLSGLAYGSVFIAEVTPKQRPAADVTAARPRNGCSSRRRGPFNGFFNVRHVTDAFHVTFKDGPHNRKLRIVMLMCIAFLITGPLNGPYCAGEIIFIFFLLKPAVTIDALVFLQATFRYRI